MIVLRFFALLCTALAAVSAAPEPNVPQLNFTWAITPLFPDQKWPDSLARAHICLYGNKGCVRIGPKICFHVPLDMCIGISTPVLSFSGIVTYRSRRDIVILTRYKDGLCKQIDPRWEPAPRGHTHECIGPIADWCFLSAYMKVSIVEN